MFPDMFKSVDLLAKGLDAAQLRQDTIANNIANADTPGFQASHVEFESYMQDALGGDGGLQMKTSRDSHFRSGSYDASTVHPFVTQDDAAQTMRMDGNDVDVEQQMTDLAKNTIWYNTLVTHMNGELERLKIAIDGR